MPLPKILNHSTFEVRAADGAGAGDGRTVVGLAVPFDVELEVFDFWDGEYSEIFRRGAFSKTIAERSKPVPLLDHHQRREPAIGASTELEEREDGLWAAFHLLTDCPAADHFLAAVRENVSNGLSIGFEPVTDVMTRGKDREPPAPLALVERLEVRLHEVSLCNFPAYEEAGVSSIRSASRAAAASRGRHPSITALAAERDRLEGVRSAALDRWGRVQRRA
jgi:Escherichia/Staphylococcus phage prohead protease